MKNKIKYWGIIIIFFAFVFWLQVAMNELQSYLSNVLNLRNSIKANLFDSQDPIDDVIYDWEPSRVLQPTMLFYPDNSVIFDKCDANWNYCDYYVLNVPNNTVEVWVDNVTSNPHCPYWWRYKFQWYSRYFKIWDRVTDADVNYTDANYPVIKVQDGINKAYSASWNEITIYFDKNIKTAQYFNFVLKNNITVYKDYKTWAKATINSVSINWNKLIITLSSTFSEDYWRIVINWNMISDIDWRLALNDMVVWDEIKNSDWIVEYIIDNLRPTATAWFRTVWNSIIITFSENIFAAEWANLYENISDQTWPLINHPSITDIDVEWNELRLFFSASPNITNISIAPNTVVDKAWNGNAQIN